MLTSRREEIVHAATELFARQGYHAVGMRAIADAVGIRGSSLYHYFPSKVELLHAIASDSTKRFIELQLADLRPMPTYAERLRKLLGDHVTYFHAYRLEEAVGLRELQELKASAPDYYAELQATRRSYQDAVERLIRDGCAAGEFDCADAHLAALAILGMVNSVNDWFRDTGRQSIEAVAAAYAAMAVDGLLGATPR